MRLEALFHISFYVTLALAAACLTAPSIFFLPWLPVLLAGLLVMCYLAWRHEGEWILSETTANQLGVFIAIGSAVWILFQIPRTEDDLIVGGVNWPAGLLPHLGPLLMILLVVKLFRPKHLPDYWVLQTMGLMMVTLAAVLADDQLFGILLAAYLASLMWSLLLYYPMRERALIASVGDLNLTPLFGSVGSSAVPWRWAGVPRAVGWTGAVFVFGFALFLTAPRQGQSQWNARQLSALTKGAPKSGRDPVIDLNRTGLVELSEEPAFAVTIRDQQGRHLDASHIPRWRVEVLEIYASGRWYPYAQTQEALTRTDDPTRLPIQTEPAALAEGHGLITFKVRPSIAGGLVLAEPIDRALGLSMNPRVDDRPQTSGFFASLDGCDIFLPATQGRRKLYTYTQGMRFPAEDRGQPSAGLDENYVAVLVNHPVPRALATWTHELLDNLPGLDATDRQLDARQRLLPSVHAKAAQALCRHLADSGEYRYTLELRREEPKKDPAVDFLVNVKEGHCERFAGGLALMLRAVGIRSRIVKGYLAGETDETGQSIVRLNQAHSWVEALVPGAEPETWRWLTLDPTPATKLAESALDSWYRWLTSDLMDARTFWRQFIMEYTPDQQAVVLAQFVKTLTSNPKKQTLLALGAATLLYLARRRIVGKVRRWFAAATTPRPSRVDFYDALLDILHRHGKLAPQPGQTPREFAAAAKDCLHRQGATNEVAEIPEKIAATYYQVRYGGQTCDGETLAQFNQSLATLRTHCRINARA